MSEPIVYADQWRTVMAMAGRRCQCTGQCGNPHTKAGGRCPRGHDRHASKHRGPVRLLAAPADLTLSALAAASLPPGELWAWCPDCHDAARRAAQRTKRHTTSADQDALFSL
ncbi:hypothetical protein JJV70_19235 [Streptomyces sp. JJ66]|uniref:hypothetical protein n=1 Tax=Streptomyces sp. JJ66 TaxID=2803843 RepID=UPI001C56C161|nr:hypothetical protein [Streptomyces sp. JJ66]MBW1604194.1 hypothetical protein [Streptomyces sp. JJ66]